MEILVISGLSGAGKSRAASFLEDMGFYIVLQFNLQDTYDLFL